jgi:predicted nucleotidyltransferase
MRLSEVERRAIVTIAREVIGGDVQVRLFGSRTDDRARGGDIDLMVETDRALPDRLQQELRLGVRLERALGGRRVDLLLVDPTVALQPVHIVARSEGVAL